MATLAGDGEGHEGWAGLQAALDTRADGAEANRRLLAALVGERGLAEAEQLAVTTVNVSDDVAFAITEALVALDDHAFETQRDGIFHYAHILADGCGRHIDGFVKGKAKNVAIVEKDWRLLTRRAIKAGTAQLRVGSGATVAYPRNAFHLAVAFADPEAPHESLRSDIAALCDGGVLVAVCPSTVVDGDFADLRKTFEGTRIIGATRVGMVGASRMPASDLIVAVKDMDAPALARPSAAADPASALLDGDDVIGTLMRDGDGLAHVVCDMDPASQRSALQGRLRAQLTEATRGVALAALGLTENPALSLAKPGSAEQVDYEVDRDGNVWLVEPNGFADKVASAGTGKAARIAAAVELAREADRLLAMEVARSTSDAVVNEGIAELARKHERYVAQFGPLVEGVMRRDLSAATRSAFVLRQLEVTDAHGNYAGRGGLLERRMLWPSEGYPEHVDDVDEALSISLEQTGGVTIGIIAGLMGVGEEEAERLLGDRVLHDPDTGALVYAEDYLVGDLGGKLDHVRDLVAQRTDDGTAEQVQLWRDAFGLRSRAMAVRYRLVRRAREAETARAREFMDGGYTCLTGRSEESAVILTAWIKRYFHQIDHNAMLTIVAALDARPGAWDPVLAPQAHKAMMTLADMWRGEAFVHLQTLATAAVSISAACREDVLSEFVLKLGTATNRGGLSPLRGLAGLLGCRATVGEVTKGLMENPAVGEWVLSQSALWHDRYVGTDELAALRATFGDRAGFEDFAARRAAVVRPRELTEEVGDLLTVEARLLEALPRRIEQKDITARLGSPWIPASIYLQFIQENMLEDHPRRSEGLAISVTLDPQTNGWSLRASSAALTEEARERWSIAAVDANDASAFRLMENAMRGTVTTIRRPVGEGDARRNVVDEELTLLAADKRADLEACFVRWLWDDPGRSEAMTSRYNKLVNRHVGRRVDGSYLRLPDVADEVQLMDHQKNAVARVLRSTEGTLLAHAVGAGKTFEGAVACHESKRLGKCHKPLVAVPNSVVGQWANEWARIYPMDRVLVMDAAASRNEDARQRFWDVARGGNWDAVIVPKSQFDRMELSPARLAATLRAEIEHYEALLADDDGPAATRRSRKGYLAGMKNRRERELHELRYDTTAACFDSLGFDMLVVDEAHHYKHLGVRSSINVAGIDRESTQSAQNLFRFCEYLRAEGKGANLLFLTGTPVTNSVTELYVMQRYLAPRSLESLGVLAFDSWAATFGETAREVEIRPEGGLQLKERFSRFSNLPELMASVHEWCDLVTNDDLNLSLPDVRVVNVDVPATATQRMCMRWLEGRGEAVRNGDVSQTIDNMLLITSDGKKVALDPKLLFADDEHVAPLAGGKVDKCADNVVDIWRRTTRAPDGSLVNGIQLVFCDSSTDKDQWNVQRDLKDRLVMRGIPERQVSTVPGTLTPAKREALFRLARAGEVRVLIGSTSTLGTGVSVQERLAAIHDLDCPWRASDLEQRLGRIRRQGNGFANCGWFTPLDFRYATVGTFDAYLYQTTARKGAFVSQVMTNDSPLREAAELSDVVLTLSEMKALASGNPAVRRRLELENEVKSLKLKRAAWRREMDDVEARRDEAATLLDYYRHATEGHEAFRATAAEMAAAAEAAEWRRAAWPLRVGDRTFDFRQEGQKLYDAQNHVRGLLVAGAARPKTGLKHVGGGDVYELGTLGKLGLGFTWVRNRMTSEWDCLPVLYKGSCLIFPTQAGDFVNAALMLADSAIKHLDANLVTARRLEARLGDLDRRAAGRWPLEAELLRKQAELDALPLDETQALSAAREYPHIADVYATLTTGRLMDLGDMRDPTYGYGNAHHGGAGGREREVVEVEDYEVLEPVRA